jgi:hypothetical protein
MSATPVRVVRLEPPEVSGREARFRWSVEPDPGLYRRRSFFLRFPESVDLSAVAPSLWWNVLLLCLHAQWPFLRPCRVRLPVRLPPGDREAWLRLLHAETATLEAYRGGVDPALDVEIEEEGAPVPAPVAAPDLGRCAVAFSGGKDSLLHAGLLDELTERPLLVTTTSPMPPLEDHQTDRRRWLLGEVEGRGNLELVEVESDFRTSWENRFSRRLGYPVSVNETTDAFLYAASLAVAGSARGATHLFLASENEVSETARLGRWVVQHPHYMYSAPTQAAVSAILAAAGLRYSSLTYALHSHQVQELLWTRYGHLRDLQYSCWKVRQGESACSRCGQCLRIALCALYLDDDPALLGVDLARVLHANRAWNPLTAPVDDASAALPQTAVSRRLRGHSMRYVEAIPEDRVRRRLARGRLLGALSPRAWLARRSFAAMKRRFAGHPFGPRPGWRRGWLRLYDPLLRAGAERIFEAAFPEEAPALSEDGLARVEELTRFAVGPLLAAR